MDNLLIGLHINKSKAALYADVVHLDDTVLDTRILRQ